MKKLFNVDTSTHYYGKLIEITSPYIKDVTLDIYPSKYFNIELTKYDDTTTNSITLIGFSFYLWWLK